MHQSDFSNHRVSFFLIYTGFSRIIAEVQNINKNVNIDPIQNLIYYKSNICNNVFLFLSFCFKDYII